MSFEDNLFKKYRERIKEFIKDSVDKSSTGGVVMGISGGIDSSVAAQLCTEALGSDRVFGVIMPSKSSQRSDIEDAESIVKKLGIDYKKIPLDNIISLFEHTLTGNGKISDRKVLGNLTARVRMVILYYFANSMNYLVCGTGNKSEIMCGYFTKYGDGGCDILPIGDIYKTEIFEFAKYLGISRKIIEKPPSAGLWVGQTDEQEMGITYRELDSILMQVDNSSDIESNFSNFSDISKINKDSEIINKIFNFIKGSEHKRNLPEICKLNNL